VSKNRQGENDLNPFLEAMKKEYLRHYPKNGDSWKHCTIEHLEKCLVRSIDQIKWYTVLTYEENPDHLIDIANFLAFLWLRTKEARKSGR